MGVVDYRATWWLIIVRKQKKKQWTELWAECLKRNKTCWELFGSAKMETVSTERMEFRPMCSDGRLSLDRKIAKLARYINDTVNNGADWSTERKTHDEARIQWAQDVFEKGVVSIARDMVISRIK